MVIPHKHAALIKAWADGAKIERHSWRVAPLPHPSLPFETVHVNVDAWVDCERPSWDDHYEYRIKPEPKPDYVIYADVSKPRSHPLLAGMFPSIGFGDTGGNLLLTFDGETLKLKKAEVI